jgi:hypothetical protein
MGDSLLEKCCTPDGMQVCMTGMLFGMVLTLILIWVYYNYLSGQKAEWFADPNDLDPQTKKLLAMANAADPPSASAARRMFGN